MDVVRRRPSNVIESLLSTLGDQPQFHEVLPMFMGETSASMFTIKLDDSLDDHPLIEFYDHFMTVVILWALIAHHLPNPTNSDDVHEGDTVSGISVTRGSLPHTDLCGDPQGPGTTMRIRRQEKIKIGKFMTCSLGYCSSRQCHLLW